MILIHFNAANRSVSLRPAGPGCYVRELKWNIDLITRAGASLNESPSLSRTAEKVSLIFWRPFLVVTFNKFISVACGPLYLALPGPFLTRTFNSCHYQWSLLPRDGVLLAACLPPPRSGGSGWFAPALWTIPQRKHRCRQVNKDSRSQKKSPLKAGDCASYHGKISKTRTAGSYDHEYNEHQCRHAPRQLPINTSELSLLPEC